MSYYVSTSAEHGLTSRTGSGAYVTYTFCSSNTLGNTSPGSMHIPDLCYTTQPWLLLSSTLAFTVNTCSVELPAGGEHAMNNNILTKWHIALSIDIGVLENH